MFTGKIHAIKRLRELVQNQAIEEAREIHEGGSCPTRMSEIGIQLRTAKEFVDECYDSAQKEAREHWQDDRISDWILVTGQGKQVAYFSDYNEKGVQNCAITWIAEHGKVSMTYKVCRIVADMSLEVSVHSVGR